MRYSFANVTGEWFIKMFDISYFLFFSCLFFSCCVVKPLSTTLFTCILYFSWLFATFFLNFFCVGCNCGLCNSWHGRGSQILEILKFLKLWGILEEESKAFKLNKWRSRWEDERSIKAQVYIGHVADAAVVAVGDVVDDADACCCCLWFCLWFCNYAVCFTLLVILCMLSTFR